MEEKEATHDMGEKEITADTPHSIEEAAELLKLDINRLRAFIRRGIPEALVDPVYRSEYEHLLSNGRYVFKEGEEKSLTIEEMGILANLHYPVIDGWQTLEEIAETTGYSIEDIRKFIANGIVTQDEWKPVETRLALDGKTYMNPEDRRVLHHRASGKRTRSQTEKAGPEQQYDRTDNSI